MQFDESGREWSQLTPDGLEEVAGRIQLLLTGRFVSVVEVNGRVPALVSPYMNCQDVSVGMDGEVPALLIGFVLNTYSVPVQGRRTGFFIGDNSVNLQYWDLVTDRPQELIILFRSL